MYKQCRLDSGIATAYLQNVKTVKRSAVVARALRLRSGIAPFPFLRSTAAVQTLHYGRKMVIMAPTLTSAACQPLSCRTHAFESHPMAMQVVLMHVEEMITFVCWTAHAALHTSSL